MVHAEIQLDLCFQLHSSMICINYLNSSSVFSFEIEKIGVTHCNGVH
jgi:hypothetical protein